MSLSVSFYNCSASVFRPQWFIGRRLNSLYNYFISRAHLNATRESDICIHMCHWKSHFDCNFWVFLLQVFMCIKVSLINSEPMPRSTVTQIDFKSHNGADFQPRIWKKLYWHCCHEEFCISFSNKLNIIALIFVFQVSVGLYICLFYFLTYSFKHPLLYLSPPFPKE